MKSMENPWKIYGKSMDNLVNLWKSSKSSKSMDKSMKIHETSMEKSSKTYEHFVKSL